MHGAALTLSCCCKALGVALVMFQAHLAHCTGAKGGDIDQSDITFANSPGRQSLVLVSACGEGSRDLYLVDFKGQSVSRIAKSPDREMEPTFSPDGKRIAFVARRQGHRQEHIFVDSLDGQNRKQLTTDDSSDRSPAFSPDGSLLVFARTVTHNVGGLASEWGAGELLCVIKVDGSGFRVIRTDGRHVMDPRFSPDGTQITFWDAAGLYTVAANGSGHPKSIADLKGRWVSFSPDGRWILYSAGKYQNDQAIFLAQVKDHKTRQIVGRADIGEKTSGYCSNPAFTADGKRVVFLFRSQPPGLNGVDKASLWEVATENGRASKIADYRLFDDPLNYFAPIADGVPQKP